jgi:hypothetical protein
MNQDQNPKPTPRDHRAEANAILAQRGHRPLSDAEFATLMKAINHGQTLAQAIETLLSLRGEANIALSETKRHANDVAAKVEGLTEKYRTPTPPTPRKMKP